MKVALATLFLAAALPLTAQAEVSRMFCVLSEKTPNPVMDRATKSVDSISENGFASTIMGRRFHASVKVESDGATTVRLYERVRLVLNQHSMIIVDEEASFGAQTEPTSDGHFATVRCRLY
jgi:hypothetical protein